MAKSNFPITPERQKILDKALAQLRKSRAAIDPAILNKIRRFIAGSPALMAQLGVDESLSPQEEAAGAPQEHKKSAMRKADGNPEKVSSKSPPKPSQDTSARHDGAEPVDQAKMMDVMAKFMDMRPDNKEQIKSVIKKTRH